MLHFKGSLGDVTSYFNPAMTKKQNIFTTVAYSTDLLNCRMSEFHCRMLLPSSSRLLIGATRNCVIIRADLFLRLVTYHLKDYLMTTTGRIGLISKAVKGCKRQVDHIFAKTIPHKINNCSITCYFIFWLHLQLVYSFKQLRRAKKQTD